MKKFLLISLTTILFLPFNSFGQIKTEELNDSLLLDSVANAGYNEGMQLKMITFLKKCSIKGVCLYEYNLYENYSTTGLNVSFYNPTHKTIKYIWITFKGTNSVHDLVGYRTLTCVGPIPPYNKASYSFDYAWLTSLVEYAKAIKIKVQYMNKSIKIITNPLSVEINDDLYQWMEDMYFNDVD